MERLLAAQKKLEEALSKEQEITNEMLEATANEKAALVELVGEAEKNRLEAESNLKAAREEFLSNVVIKRNEKLTRRKWIDVEGNEHMIEYLIV